jgi:hypothetical protein
MSFVPGGSGTANVSSTAGSGIVVTSSSLLSSGLVAGTNISLTADPAFGGKGLRIDASGGGGGLATVSSSNGSGINVSQVGANANLTSALVAGTGIALTPSSTTKVLTVSNTQTVASAGNGSGINATVVGNQTNLSTNLIAGAGVAITPSGLNSSINISSPAAASAVQSITGSTNIATTGGTTPTVSLVPDVVLPLNGSLSINRTAGPLSPADLLEVWNAAGTGYHYVGAAGDVGFWNIAGGLPGVSEWDISPAGDAFLSTLTTSGLATVNSLFSNGAATVGSLTSSGVVSAGSYTSNGTLAITGTAATGALTTTGQASVPSLFFQGGQVTLSSAPASNRVQVSTPGGNAVLAYTSDIPPLQTLEQVCQTGNEVASIGIKFLPPTPTPTPGAFIRSNATNTLNFINSDLNSPITLNMDQAGTVSAGVLNLQGGALNVASPIGSGRISVSGGPSPQTVAYLSDITGGGGGVQTVSAGSNISIGGTATDPTVSLVASPNISGTLTVNGTTPNYFNSGIYAPGLIVNNNFTSPTGNAGVAIVTPSSSVVQMTSQDGSSPCQLRVVGTAQISSAFSGGSTVTLSTANSNLRVNNVNVLTAATGMQYNVSTSTVAPGTITLTAADFYQTRLYDLNATGTLTINLPNVSSGTVPIGSYINIGRAVNDVTPGASIVVQQSFSAPSITISNSNQIVTFILTGYSSTTPLYSCIGGF